MKTSRLPTEYQNFIALSRYARWIEKENKRETWPETVDRYIDFFKNRTGKITNVGSMSATTAKNAPPNIPWEKLRKAILNLEVMPSMRCLMTAGRALERDNVAGYNCAYVNIDNLRVFPEILFVLCCGTGVGFSVERKYVKQLPEIAETFEETDTTIVVRDSKIGWANALKELISMLYQGRVPKWDVSKIRPAGARLKTFGGRASGPEPLVELFEFCVQVIRKNAGSKLSTLDCHDIVTKIGEVVVVGGVRRSACISLSSLTDDRMAKAKMGQWWIDNPQRALANNSVCYTEPPEVFSFMKEWLRLYESKSGERGMFNLKAARELAEKNTNGRRDGSLIEGTNPCSEILLRSKQFCNLSEAVIRKDDTFEQIKKKVAIAAIFGTLQATLTNFRFLSKKWEANTKEESLLGVSLTGIMDHPVLNGSGSIETLAEWLTEFKKEAFRVNKKYAKILGIPQATAITAVKPSGTCSALVDSASGIHARHAPYYIRTVRADNKDPLCQFMKSRNFPHEPEAMKPDSVTVFSFPMKSPAGCVCRTDRTAVEQLELWKVYQIFYCEHKPSITVSVKEHEWVSVGAWVWENFDLISGVSFLPYSEHTYQQAPFQECDEETYTTLLNNMPKGVDWSELPEFEKEDKTAGNKTLACTGNSCEIVDLV